MKYGKCQCDKCGEMFKIKPKEKVIDGVKIVFLQCPKCKQRSLAYVEDDELKERVGKVTKISLDKRRAFIKENRRLMENKIAQYQHLIRKVIKPEN